jgi:hypothetical protein
VLIGFCGALCNMDGDRIYPVGPDPGSSLLLSFVFANDVVELTPQPAAVANLRSVGDHAAHSALGAAVRVAAVSAILLNVPDQRDVQFNLFDGIDVQIVGLGNGSK